ncbi:uncharacterized protein LOC100900315 [Galendromus occidentalis]|uniref:Uncharacterized protein LOC100900315 n=1 Tax=Galendromus occidentalis TaxID=34638 RepID=A0AAJ6QVF0_9ACAR|nr:uncharacterized protein LOC100900315 [Galendromus occidentalis]
MYLDVHKEAKSSVLDGCHNKKEEDPFRVSQKSGVLAKLKCTPAVHPLDRRESLEDWSPSESSQLGEAGVNEASLTRSPFSLDSYIQQLHLRTPVATCKSSQTSSKDDKMDVDGIVPQIAMGSNWPNTDISNFDGTDSGSEDQPLDLSLNRSSPDSSGHSTTSGGSISIKRKSSDSVTSTTSGVSSPLRTTTPPATPVPTVPVQSQLHALPTLLTGVPQKRTYTEEELQAALRDIQAGKLGTRRAAVIYGIPRSTLRNKVYKLANDKRKIEQAESRLRASQNDFDPTPEAVKTNNGAASESLRQLLKSTIAQKGTLPSPAPSSSGESCSPPLGLGSLLGVAPPVPAQDTVQMLQHFLTSIQHMAMSGMLPSENMMPELFKQFPGHERVLEDPANLSAKNSNLMAIGGVLGGLRGLGVGLGLGMEGLESKLHSSVQPGVGEQLNSKNVVKSDKHLDAVNNQKKAPQMSADGKVVRPKRGRYRNYNRDNLLQAVHAVQRGEMSVHRAGTFYGVPHSTLEYKVKERHLLRPKKRAQKPQTSSVPTSPSPVPPSLTVSTMDARPYPWAPAIAVSPLGTALGDNRVPSGPFFTPHVIKDITDKDDDSDCCAERKSPLGTDEDNGKHGVSVLEQLIKCGMREKSEELGNDDSDAGSSPALKIAEVPEEMVVE